MKRSRTQIPQHQRTPCSRSRREHRCSSPHRLWKTGGLQQSGDRQLLRKRRKRIALGWPLRQSRRCDGTRRPTGPKRSRTCSWLVDCWVVLRFWWSRLWCWEPTVPLGNCERALVKKCQTLSAAICRYTTPTHTPTPPARPPSVTIPLSVLPALPPTYTVLKPHCVNWSLPELIKPTQPNVHHSTLIYYFRHLQTINEQQCNVVFIYREYIGTFLNNKTKYACFSATWVQLGPYYCEQKALLLIWLILFGHSCCLWNV